MGNVFPPSVESEILTVAALTGAADVLATFHVTVCCVPPVQLTFVFGCVTRNGPALAFTTTCAVAVLMAPPPTRLSRTVTLKIIVRLIVGNASLNVDVLFKTSDNLGKVREGFDVGLNERKMGRAFPSPSVSGGEAGPRS